MKKIILTITLALIALNAYAFKSEAPIFTHTLGMDASYHSVHHIGKLNTLSPKYTLAQAWSSGFITTIDTLHHMYSNHTVVLANYDDRLKSYTYHYYFACNGNFAELKHTVWLEHNETYEDDGRLTIVFESNHTGLFPIYVLTEITGEETAKDVQNSQAVIVH